MPEESKKIIVDDDWKAEAKKEKERLAAETGPEGPARPEPSFADLVNIIVMPVMAALGMLVGPGGQPTPPDAEAAKHFIDMLQLLEDKTRNNLTPEEKGLLDQVLYETRMAFVQVAGGGAAGPAAAPAQPPPAAPGG